jgi:ABC-type multidrug transport system ATPase subunit
MEANRAVNPPVLETLSLTRRFGEHTAVDSLTVSAKRGEVFGLLGPAARARRRL